MNATMQAPTQPEQAKKKTSTYRLLAGLHDTGKRIYQTGELIESELDLLMFNGRGTAPKYQLVHGEEDGKIETRIGPDARVFDPAKETIDQFTARVKAEQDRAKLHGFGDQETDVARAARQGFDSADKPAPKPIEQWSKEELLAAAEAEEIDLKGAKTQAEIIKILKVAGVGK